MITGICIGQGVQLFGNVNGGMLYDVDIDGSVSSGNPSGSVLASVPSLEPGSHTIMLIAKPSTQDSSSLLVFESATVTVGTGLTGYCIAPQLSKQSR
jgi:hypothetical protein